jgi:hypothetical protein
MGKARLFFSSFYWTMRARKTLALIHGGLDCDSDALTTVREEVPGSLLDDDALVSESGERVLKGAVRWMKVREVEA